MNIEVMLNQTITRWQRTGQDGYNKPIFATPTTMSGRWEAGRVFGRGDDKETIINSAKVFLTEAVSVGDYLYLGESTATNPLTLSGAGEVKDCKDYPSVDASVFLYVALVMCGLYRRA